jgi:hypothetical protein
MPITFTPLGPSPAAIGWGMSFTVSSDFIGPLPTGSFFDVVISTDSEGANPIVQVGFNTNTTTPSPKQLTIHNSGMLFGNSSATVGQTVHVITQLVQSGTTVVDSGATTMPWVNSSSDNVQLLQDGSHAGDGLTSTQAAQLATVVDNTQTTQEVGGVTTTISVGEQLAAKSIDALTTVEITSGPTSDPVTHNLAVWTQAVLVTITGIAPIDVPQTPDQDYFLRDLAVLRIFHGGNLSMRVPIHTSSRIVDLHTDRLNTIVTAVEVALWPPAVTLEVDFARGVTGQVFLLLLP